MECILSRSREKYNKNSGQVTLRFLVQIDIVALGKSATLEHMRENLDIFDFALWKRN